MYSHTRHFTLHLDECTISKDRYQENHFVYNCDIIYSYISRFQPMDPLELYLKALILKKKCRKPFFTFQVKLLQAIHEKTISESC